MRAAVPVCRANLTWSREYPKNDRRARNCGVHAARRFASTSGRGDQARHMLIGRHFEATVDQHTEALAVFKRVGLRALLAKPEVPHTLRVRRSLALRMTLAKTEYPPSPIIEGRRTV